MTEKSYRVTGMGCESCVTRIKKAAASLDGVLRAEVDLVSENLTVEFDENKTGFAGLKQAVQEAGYGLEEI
jgi:Cu+-exporting ATPase